MDLRTSWRWAFEMVVLDRMARVTHNGAESGHQLPLEDGASAPWNTTRWNALRRPLDAACSFMHAWCRGAARGYIVVSLSRRPRVPKISLFYYYTLDGGRTFSRSLRLSLHAGRTYAKVMAQKINLTLSSSTPKFFCLPAFLPAPQPTGLPACRPASLPACLPACMPVWCVHACVRARACTCACVHECMWVRA